MASDPSQAAMGGMPSPVSAGSNRVLWRHTLLYFVGRALPALMTVASVPVFIRALGADVYGRYALYAALALTAGNTGGAWIGQPVLRFASRFREASDGAYDSAVRRGRWIAAGGASAVTALGVLFLPHDRYALASAVALAGTGAVVAVTFSELQAALQARKANLIEVLRVGVSVGVPLVAVFLLGIREPAVLLLGAALGNVAATISASPRGTPARSTPWRRQVILQRLVRFGTPLAAWMLVSSVLNLADRFLIEWTLGTAAVGGYAAVYDIVYKGVVFACTPMLMAAHPIITSAWNSGRPAEARHVLLRALTLAAAVGLPVTAVAWLASPWLVELVLGDEVTPVAAGLVGPVAAGAFLWQIAMLAHKPLELREQTRTMLVGVSLALAVNVTFNWMLLPIYGVLAAAYATVAGAVLYLCFVTVRINRFASS